MPCVCYQQLPKEIEGPEPQLKKRSDLENSLLSLSFTGKTDGNIFFPEMGTLGRGPWRLPCVILRLLRNNNHIRILQRVKITEVRHEH